MGLILMIRVIPEPPSHPHPRSTSRPQPDSLLFVTNLVWTADYVCTVISGQVWYLIVSIPILCLL